MSSSTAFRPARRTPRQRRVSGFGLLLSLLIVYLIYRNTGDSDETTHQIVLRNENQHVFPPAYALPTSTATTPPNTNTRTHRYNPQKPQQPSCSSLPAMDDILVVLKTGVTEARDKVPVHLETTLRCIPHYVIFSDTDEHIGQAQTYDVLRDMPLALRETLPEFDLYNRVRATGRGGLTDTDLTQDVNSNFGKQNNPGWKLDKWKFLPMVNRTRAAMPHAKWYVFMEADTYPVWENLVTWLAQFDPQRPYYLGNQMQIGDVLFGHGGSGFVLSQAALAAADDLWQANVARWDEFTAGQWAGDCVLGQLLNDAGVGLLWAWPHLQREPPGEFDYFNEGYGKKPWCYAPVAFHHLTPEEVRELAEFEQRWRAAGNSRLLYADVFQNMVKGKMSGIRENWDSHGEAGPEDAAALEAISMVECRSLCVSDPKCVQYVFAEGRCWTSPMPKLGAPREGFTSGWLPDRVSAVAGLERSCRRASWVLD